MTRTSGDFQIFRTKLLELSRLESTVALLDWDQQTFMPENGASVRSDIVAYLSGLQHKKFTSRRFEKILKSVKSLQEKGKLNTDEVAIFREVYREYERQSKLPVDFVIKLAKLTSEAHFVWAKARKMSDFAIFSPFLKRIIDLKRKEAEYVGFKESPYDALLDIYEPGITAKRLDLIFADLKKFLILFVKARVGAQGKINPQIFNGNYPVEKQKVFNIDLAQRIGFDFNAGRLDTSHHPFTTNFHPQDVRITTRYSKKNFWYSVGSTIHEVGHALYEQGLNPVHFGTPLCESISLGIHESQSRLWENQIGKSRAFWQFFYPKLQKTFSSLKAISLEDFYKAINYVEPSLIRTEADEVTYNLHIILRFEIERDLIEGRLKVEDLPFVWNRKIKDYFGLDVPNDAQGVLQDVHWSGGAFGYFPTYSLGNLYSAQFYKVILKDIPSLEEQLAKGEFSSLLTWLRENIHQYGKRLSADELCKKLTGEDLNSKYFIDYIKNKYS